MAYTTIKNTASGFTPIAILTILLLLSLYMMSVATQNAQAFSQLYVIVLIANILGLMVLLGLIANNILRLIRQYRSNATGSRLTLRLVLIFVLLSLTPAAVVYYFSLSFIQSGIDSWFNVRIEQALDDALELSRSSLNNRNKDFLRQTEQISSRLENLPDEEILSVMNKMLYQSGAFDITLYTRSGHIIASSSDNITRILPSMPTSDTLRQLNFGANFVGLEASEDGSLHIRVTIEIPRLHTLNETRLLQARYPINDRINQLANSVANVSDQYKQLTQLREPLKFSFSLTLSLVLLLGLLSAVWAAFFSARRLVAPIRVLAIGTRAVAAGDYDKHLPMNSNDELGFLVQSFNDMTRKISTARHDAKRSQQQAERERAYLRAVLGRLSSGVLTLDNQQTIRTANVAAGQMLQLDIKSCVGQSLASLAESQPRLQELVTSIQPHLIEQTREWRKEITLTTVSGKQMLMCGGASLPSSKTNKTGHVIVFDDVTALIQVQRDAAWGEVARRLAHEIKNPLTPIQLSAERLRHKYLHTMSPSDADILDRSTYTIIQQVLVMKEMVQAFAEYARSPHLNLQSININDIINQVIDLYQSDETAINICTQLGQQLPLINGDTGRIRQLLHNLIKNAMEASQASETCHVTISTQLVLNKSQPKIEIHITDNGAGLSNDIIGQLFEPYVTTKPKGSGLGLAVVKKIVEEHGGTVWAKENDEQGITIIIQLPVAEASSPTNTPLEHT